MKINLMTYCSRTTLAIIAVDLLATSGDITMTWTSPMLSKFYSNDSSINPLSEPITKNQDALIVSLINVGAMFGALPFGYVSEHFGRKLALLMIGVFHMIAYMVMAFARRVELFYFGRLFGGLAVGGGYTLLPLYIAEVAEESKRGFYSVTLGIFWAFGNFFSYLVGPFVSVRYFNLFNFCFPFTFFILFLLLGTETPFYLVGANKMSQAEKVLTTLRSKDNKDVQDELAHIKNTLDLEDDSTGSFKLIFFNRGIRKAFIISILLISFQQFSGWNAITSYLQQIFEASGSDIPSDISSLLIGAAILVFSLPAPYYTDRFNRKVLIIFSTTLIGLCLIFLGIFFFIQNRTEMSTKAISWIPVTSLIIMVFAFESGMACLPWTVSSEIFPKNIKKISSTSTSTACWFTSFLMTQFFNNMTDALGVDGTFFLFSGFCFGCALFTLFYIPETRGKTFTEIQQILQR